MKGKQVRGTKQEKASASRKEALISGRKFGAVVEPKGKYQTIFETTGTATIIIEEDMTISLANSEFEKLSGYARSEVEGKKGWPEFVANQEDLERMKKYHKSRRTDPIKAPRNYEFKFIDRAGAVKDIYATLALIPRTRKSVGSFLDISERKRVEEQLKRSEKRFRDLVENSPSGILIIQDGEVVYQNPEQERLFGTLPRSSGIADLQNIYPDDAAEFRRFCARISSGKFQTLETDLRFYHLGKIGSRHDMKWVYCRATPIEYLGKKATLVNMIDVSQAKEMERLLRIHEKMTSLGRVAAGIAHEIRNPLSGINLYLSTLEKIYARAEGIEKVREILTQLQTASRKIESVIRRVMDFSKPTAPARVLTNMNTPIEEAIMLSTAMLRKRGIKIEQSLAEHLPQCFADPQLLEEVILNLITNAADAADAAQSMNGAKLIEILSSVEKDRILVKVSDSGPGVPPELREQIFDPFFSTKDGSAGIGLSICHRIITDHGGSLTVKSSKWGGAEFVISLPIQGGPKPR